MSSVVFFAPFRPKEVRRERTLPCLLERMLDRFKLKDRFNGKKVAIKMHLGGGVGFTTIHPLLVRTVVSAVKRAGGFPFITDVPSAVFSARDRGYTEEVLGAKLLPVTGIADRYIVREKIGYRTLKEVHLAGNVVDADSLIVLSHGKGHGQAGFGGAIKNIAMGCVDGWTRNQIHRLMSGLFCWDDQSCTRCLLCSDNCPNGAITLKDNKITINDHACKYCMHCVNICPHGAISIDQRGYRYFQRGMALTTRALLRRFKPEDLLYITVLLNITPFCDCWGFSLPSIVPDIGILSSEDIVAMDKASIDMIKEEDFIEGSLAYPLKREGKGHLLEQIHGKDPYIQIQEAIKVGLGSGEYTIKRIT